MKQKVTFEEKTALVTGSTRGIGKSIADLLAELGCRVIYTGTSEESKCKQGHTYLQLDLSDDESIAAFLKKLEDVPSIDILVNNAGTNKIDPIYELKQCDWDKIIKVNLTGSMLLTKEVSKKMISNKCQGRILNISSIFGLVSKAKRNSYSASKSAVIGLTRASALDLAPYNILVNVLCPGFTRTDLTASILSKQDMEDLCKEIPLERFANESEIAQTAVFFCSDLNTYITGQAIVVDGGFTAR